MQTLESDGHYAARKQIPPPNSCKRVASTSEITGCTHDKGFDCVVPDLRPPDMAEFKRLQNVWAQSVLTGLPVVVFARNNLKGEGHVPFQSIAKSDVLKKVRLSRKRSPRLPLQASK